MDAAMVMESLGKIKYKDKGNMTRDEIDKTIAFLIDAKKAGQFRAFWKSFDESVNWRSRHPVDVVAGGCGSAIQGHSVQVPTAGGRLSLLGRRPRHCLSCQGPMLDAAYEYINWYLSGWVGAYLNRQGYYTAVLETAKKYMSPNEWDYWMEGKPATADIVSPTSQVMEKVGAVRDGGSFYERMGHVSCWNSVMDEDRYMVQKWNEFIAA